MSSSAGRPPSNFDVEKNARLVSNDEFKRAVHRTLLQEKQRVHLRRENARKRRRSRIRRNRMIAIALVSVLILGAWAIVAALGSSGSRSATRGSSSHLWVAHAGPTTIVAGHVGHFAWPSTGEAAVGLQGEGVIASSPRQRVVPIASMTKMMTAILVLHDHPLSPGEAGPSVTMTHADATAWVIESQNGDATVQVRAGERLSEYQLLEALLMPSGDNIADILATWDAGSIPAFVAKMNAHARQLNLHHTAYADPSGVSPGSKSTPSDQVTVASQLMENTVARQIVAQSSVALPVAGTIHNVNPALGSDGILGVKSGFTQAAMGCLAVAAMRTVAGKQIMVITVSTGSTDGLYGAARVDEQLLAETGPDLVAVAPIRTGSFLANIDLANSTTQLPLHSLGTAPTFVAWRGAHLTSKVFVSPTAAPGDRGLVARLVYSTPTGTLGSVKLTSAAIPTISSNGTKS